MIDDKTGKPKTREQFAEMIEDLKREFERGAREHEQTMARLKAERREALRADVNRMLSAASWDRVTESDVAVLEAVLLTFVPDDDDWVRARVREAWAAAKGRVGT